MERAEIEQHFDISGYEDVECGILHWPLSVIRLRAKDSQRLVVLATKILENWRAYTDEAAFLFASTDEVLHNTITPIARKKGEVYELDLTLRNNITTEQSPLGVFHPRAAYHHIKKENIGLIEVMGLAVLPKRLDDEMKEMRTFLLSHKQNEVVNVECLKKHEAWLEQILSSYADLPITENNVDNILQQEIGKVFVKVLEDAGVFKCTTEGRAAFLLFINSIS